MNVRSLKSRIRRCEAKMGGKAYLRAFMQSLSRDEQKYVENAFILSGLEDDGTDPDETAVGVLMGGLNIDEDAARDLWRRYRSAFDSEPCELGPEFARMSDEEMTAYIEDSREEIRQFVAEGWLE